MCTLRIFYIIRDLSKKKEIEEMIHINERDFELFRIFDIFYLVHTC